MKGIIFNLLEQVVSEEYDEKTWEALLDGAKLDGAYTAVGSYPDEDLLALVGAASTALGTPADDVVRWFGRKAMPLMVQRYPQFFEGHESTRPFLLSLNDIIHPEVRKLFPGAYAPSFIFDESVPGKLSLSYVSQRNLCPFAEGLIDGAADHFGETVTIEHSECQRRGGANCVLVCTFEPKGSD